MNTVSRFTEYCRYEYNFFTEECCDEQRFMEILAALISKHEEI